MERSGMKQSVAYYGHYYNCVSSVQVVYEHFISSEQVAASNYFGFASAILLAMTSVLSGIAVSQ
jgi:hypothetical protein